MNKKRKKPKASQEIDTYEDSGMFVTGREDMLRHNMTTQQYRELVRSHSSPEVRKQALEILRKRGLAP